ncbi:MAG: TrkA C-terminal domain-containing protein [Methanocellales archaeon]
MTVIQEAHLPGVGSKYIVETERGDRVVILIYLNGNREVYFHEKRSIEPTSVITFSDEEARKVGAILEGAFFRPIPCEELITQLKGLQIEWYKLEKKHQCIGHTIAEKQIRKRTGVSIIAILRGRETIPSPDPYSTLLLEGDTLVTIGTREQHLKFEKEILGE